MFRLVTILYSMIGTTLAGSAMVAALVTGHDTLMPLVVVALVGFVVAIPVSFWVARAMMRS